MFKNLMLIVLTLASVSAFADSPHPICTGTQLDPAIRGTYETVTKDAELQKITFGENTATVQFQNQVATFKAWSCTSDGVAIIVYNFGKDDDGQEGYENRIVLIGGDHLVDIGEVFDDADINFPPDTKMSVKLQHLLQNNAADFMVMRRKN